MVSITVTFETILYHVPGPRGSDSGQQLKVFKMESPKKIDILTKQLLYLSEAEQLILTTASTYNQFDLSGYLKGTSDPKLNVYRVHGKKAFDIGGNPDVSTFSEIMWM